MHSKGQLVSADDLMTGGEAPPALGMKLLRRAGVDELGQQRRQSRELENRVRGRSGGGQ
jgi:hypothetical protein